MQQRHLQEGYVLHYRHFRDTSLLLDLFTPEFGRFSAIAKGARAKRSPLKGLLQPFVPLLIIVSGRTELLNLYHAESDGIRPALKGEGLMSAFYLNELLMRLLQRHDPYPEVFHAYHQTLMTLELEKNPQPALRVFEKKLLAQLGYALQLTHDANSRDAIEADTFYYFEPTHGFTRCTHQQRTHHTNIFLGKNLLDLHEENFENQHTLQAAKRLMRLALAPLLGNKEIKSRELFCF